MGKHILANLDPNKQKITIISREESNATFPSSMTVKKTDYSHSSLVSALSGNDILIITLALTTPPDQETKLIAAAAEAGVKYVMPNMWGIDLIYNTDLHRDLAGTDGRLKINKQITDSGMKWMSLTCGFWYEYSLSNGTDMYGFDFQKKTVRFYDDGNTKMNTSTWELSGEAVGKVLQLPIQSSGGGDGPSLKDFENRAIRISSFLISQKDMFESVKRVTGTQDKDWKIEYVSSEKIYKERSKSMAEKGFNVPDWAALLYARLFFQDDAGYFEKRLGLDNDVLGLEKEDLDTCTKKAIDRVKKGETRV